MHEFICWYFGISLREQPIRCPDSPLLTIRRWRFSLFSLIGHIYLSGFACHDIAALYKTRGARHAHLVICECGEINVSLTTPGIWLASAGARRFSSKVLIWSAERRLLIFKRYISPLSQNFRYGVTISCIDCMPFPRRRQERRRASDHYRKMGRRQPPLYGYGVFYAPLICFRSFSRMPLHFFMTQ